MRHLIISLPQKDGFSKVKYSYIKSAYYGICDDYGVNADQKWMNGNWFYTTKYGVLMMKEWPQKSLHQEILNNGLPNVKVFRFDEKDVL